MAPSTSSDALMIAEAQFLLAEKRTSLATVRTGIALFALPFAILSALIATSKMYDTIDVLHFPDPGNPVHLEGGKLRVPTPEVVNCVSALLSRVDGSARPQHDANLGQQKGNKRSRVSHWLRLG